MSERVGVILQPSYVPWRGFFDLIHRADVFVFYDDVQYDKHGWRNRNRIKTPAGPQWLTIPVSSKGNVVNGLQLCDARVTWTQDWPRKHAMTLRQCYGKAPFFAELWPMLEAFYAARPERLVDFTIETTLALAKALGISHTRFVRSSELDITGGRTERLVRILEAVSATHYISGPSARSYLEEAMFAEAKIGLEYMVYEYPEYEQLYPPYDPGVSVLDLLFMKGPGAGEHIWGSRAARTSGSGATA
ncbi:MAG TPA: WbqC family protein [Kofleriaceae bacterium]|nr:WbqC family protein [Kofleriaceae bacterium]